MNCQHYKKASSKKQKIGNPCKKKQEGNKAIHYTDTQQEDTVPISSDLNWSNSKQKTTLN